MDKCGLERLKNASLAGIVMDKQELEHCFPEVMMKYLGNTPKWKQYVQNCVWVTDKIPSSDLYMVH